MDKNDLLNMPFDQYQRYMICREIIDIIHGEMNLDQIHMLDVGGYFKNAKGLDVLPITNFFPEYNTIALDIVDCKLPGYIRGDGAKLPFRDEAVDIVICLDTLEHIPLGQRNEFLENILQVAKKFVILSAPFFSEQVNLAERILFEFILRTLKAEHQQLKEHIDNKLPTLDAVKTFLDQKGFPYCYFEGGYLNNFLLMMMVKHYVMALPDSTELQSMIDRFYNLNFYESDQRSPGYRKTFVIAKDRSYDKILKKIDNKFTLYREKYKYLTLEKSDLTQLQLLLNLEQLSITRKIQEQSQQIQEHNLVIQEQSQQIQALVGELKLIKNSRMWRAAEFFRRLVFIKLLGKFPLLQKGAQTISKDGFPQFLTKTKNYLRKKAATGLIQNDYKKWIKKNELPEKTIQEIQREIAQFLYKPKISIVMPVYNVDQIWLEKAIDSVINQLYKNWELCIADDASSKKHIKETLERYSKKDERIKIKYLEKNQGISGASNEALALAAGDFIGLLDNDDELTVDALYENVKLLNRIPEADMIYSDEDKLELNGDRCDPYFKPDWSPDTFLSVLYTCHFGVYRKNILDQIGGFRKGYEGSQDSDLVLRITEKTNKIFHIPKILYHWRKIPGSASINTTGKSYSYVAAKKALTDYLERNNIDGDVLEGHFVGSYRVRRTIKNKPEVSIIIPFKDHAEVLKKCVNSLIKKTTYRNFGIHLINNRSEKMEIFQYLDELKNNPICKVWNYDKPFNFSAINNYVVSQIDTEYLIFLNSDTEVISPDWITAMLEFAQRKDVGAVGSLLYYPNDTIQHAGVIIGIGGGVAGHSHKFAPRNSYGYFGRIKIVQNLSAVTAACMMTKKSVFCEVGGFDENFAYAYNDVDFCLKIRGKGYLIVYTPYAELYHHESLSRGYDDNPQKKAVFQREEKAFQEKWEKVLNQGDPYYNPNLTRDKEDFSIRK